MWRKLTSSVVGLGLSGFCGKGCAMLRNCLVAMVLLAALFGLSTSVQGRNDEKGDCGGSYLEPEVEGNKVHVVWGMMARQIIETPRPREAEEPRAKQPTRRSKNWDYQYGVDPIESFGLKHLDYVPRVYTPFYDEFIDWCWTPFHDR